MVGVKKGELPVVGRPAGRRQAGHLLAELKLPRGLRLPPGDPVKVAQRRDERRVGELARRALVGVDRPV